MHEVVFNGLLDKSTGITTLDVAKRLMDYGASKQFVPLSFHKQWWLNQLKQNQKHRSFIDVMKKNWGKENPEIQRPRMIQ